MTKPGKFSQSYDYLVIAQYLLEHDLDGNMSLSDKQWEEIKAKNPFPDQKIVKDHDAELRKKFQGRIKTYFVPGPKKVDRHILTETVRDGNIISVKWNLPPGFQLTRPDDVTKVNQILEQINSARDTAPSPFPLAVASGSSSVPPARLPQSTSPADTKQAAVAALDEAVREGINLRKEVSNAMKLAHRRALELQREQIESSLTDVKRKADSTIKDLEAQLSEKAKTLTGKEDLISQQAGEISQKEQQLSAHSEEIFKKNTEIVEHAKELAKVREQLEKSQAASRELASKVQAQTKTIEQVRKDNSDLLTRIDIRSERYEVEIANLKRQNAMQQHEIATQRDEISKVSFSALEEKSDLEQAFALQRTRFQVEITEIKRKASSEASQGQQTQQESIRVFEERLSRAENDHKSKLHDAQKAHDDAVRTLQIELTRAQEDYDKKMSDTQHAHEQEMHAITQRTAQDIAAQKQTNAKLAADIATVTNDNTKLAAETATVANDNTKLLETITRLRRERDDLRSKNSQIVDEHNELVDQNIIHCETGNAAIERVNELTEERDQLIVTHNRNVQEFNLLRERHLKLLGRSSDTG